MTQARPDIILHENGLILLIQEDKAYMSTADPGPQLIAQAIAAFRHNNLRHQDLHLEPLADAIIPGITMIRTMPTFYSIPITTELVNAVCIDCIDQFSGDVNTIKGWYGSNHRNSRDDGLSKGFQMKVLAPEPYLL